MSNQTSMTQTQCIYSARPYFSASSEKESSYIPYMRKKLWTSSLIDNNLFVVALQKHKIANIFSWRCTTGEKKEKREWAHLCNWLSGKKENSTNGTGLISTYVWECGYYWYILVMQVNPSTVLVFLYILRFVLLCNWAWNTQK